MTLWFINVIAFFTCVKLWSQQQQIQGLYQDFQGPRSFSRTFYILENAAVKYKSFWGLSIMGNCVYHIFHTETNFLTTTGKWNVSIHNLPVFANQHSGNYSTWKAGNIYCRMINCDTRLWLVKTWSRAVQHKWVLKHNTCKPRPPDDCSPERKCTVNDNRE